MFVEVFFLSRTAAPLNVFPSVKSFLVWRAVRARAHVYRRRPPGAVVLCGGEMELDDTETSCLRAGGETCSHLRDVGIMLIIVLSSDGGSSSRVKMLDSSG